MLSMERKGRVIVATLSRAPVNALNDVLLARIEAALDDAVADEEVSVLHIRSGLKAFCAGADLALMQSCMSSPQGIDTMVEVVRGLQRVFARIESAPVLTLAEIGGAAMGGGLELALACDVRIAATEAKLGLPEARLGLVPGAGGTQRLARLCGQGVAKRLILGAEVVDGAEAERLGIVQWARPRVQLAAWAGEVAGRFAAIPRAALAEAKQCIAAQADPNRDGFELEIEVTRRLYAHPETRRRVSDFLKKSAS